MAHGTMYPLRISVDGAMYHVTARGDNRELIFFDDEDYQNYLLLLKRYKDRFQFKLHAYALMPNHIHLILEPAAGTTLSRIMQCTAIAYTKTFNQRHKRVGHVFQGRFFSRLIAEESYLLAASRYVHLNPVRAKLAAQPIDYPWSSYRAYCDPAQNVLQLVDDADTLELIHAHPTQQRSTYREFVEMAVQNVSDII